MAFGRPRQPNDPSIMASVETAMSTVARPGLIGRVWHWRYELGQGRPALRLLASDVRVVVNDRRSHIVVLEVIRRTSPDSPPGGSAGWPYLDRGETGSAEPEEPALYYGLGLPRPLG
jgi:hypothetical protein